MIDGLYIRQSLKAAPLSIDASVALVEDYVAGQLAAHPPLEGEGRTKVRVG